MLHKIIIDSTRRSELQGYISKTALVYGDRETIYAKKDPIHPKTSKEDWLFDFRRVFLDSYGVSLLREIILSEYGDKNIQQFATIELGSVPLSGALLSKLPDDTSPVFHSALLIRKSRKKHGLGNIIEGIYKGGDIILIDDIVNSGESIFRSIKILEDTGIVVKRVFCILCFLDEIFLKQLHNKYPHIIVDYIFDISDFGLKLKKDKKKSLPLPIFPATKSLYTPPFFHKTLVVPKSSPLYCEGVVYVAGESGKVVAISVTDQHVIWEYQVDLTRGGKNILSSLREYKDTIVFGSYNGSIYVLDKITGNPLNIFSVSDWIGGTPCIDLKHDLIYVGLEIQGPMAGAIASLNRLGEVLWFVETKDFIHCSPYYIEEKDIVICGTNGGELFAIQGSTGEIVWQIQIGGAIKASFCYISEKEAICFGSFDRSIYCIDVLSGAIFWNIITSQSVYSTPLYYGGDIFIGCIDRKFYHLSIQGEILFEYETGGRIFSMPTVYKKDYIVFGSNDMRLYFYNRKQKNMMFYIQHSERITTVPIFHNDKVYISDFANRLFEYDLTSITTR